MHYFIQKDNPKRTILHKLRLGIVDVGVEEGHDGVEVAEGGGGGAFGGELGGGMEVAQGGRAAVQSPAKGAAAIERVGVGRICPQMRRQFFDFLFNCLHRR